MLYLFTGEDIKSRHIAYEDFFKSIPKKTEMFQISRNNFDRMQLESLYSGQGLFFTKSAVVFSDVLANEETRDFILDKLELMGESESDFIFLEGKLNKPIIDAFKRRARRWKFLRFHKKTKEKKKSLIIFSWPTPLA